MKRLQLFLSCLFLLNGCQNNPEQIVVPCLSYDAGNDDCAPIKIDPQQFETWIEKEGSFPLFVYKKECDSCSLLPSMFSSYVKNNKIVFPYLYIDEYNNVKNPYPLSDSAFLFFNKGILVNRKTSFDNIGSLSDLTSYLYSNLKKTNVILLNSGSANEEDFPSLTLSYSIHNETDNIVPYEFVSLKTSSIFYLNELTSFSNLFKSLESNKITHIAFNKDDFTPNSYFSKEYHITSFDKPIIHIINKDAISYLDNL